MDFRDFKKKCYFTQKSGHIYRVLRQTLLVARHFRVTDYVPDVFTTRNHIFESLSGRKIKFFELSSIFPEIFEIHDFDGFQEKIDFPATLETRKRAFVSWKHRERNQRPESDVQLTGFAVKLDGYDHISE